MKQITLLSIVDSQIDNIHLLPWTQFPIDLTILKDTINIQDSWATGPIGFGLVVYEPTLISYEFANAKEIQDFLRHPYSKVLYPNGNVPTGTFLPSLTF